MTLTPLPGDTLEARVASLWQVVLGVSGQNGLRGSMLSCRERREKAEADMMERFHKLEIRQAKVGALVGLISGLISGGVLLLARVVLGG